MSGLLIPVLAAAALTSPDVDARFIMALDGSGGPAMVVELFVAPDHTVQECKVVVPRSSERPGEDVCRQALRMRVPTVGGVDGNPVHGFVTVARIARGYGPATPPWRIYPTDLEIGVAALPGRDIRKTIFVRALVDAAGAVARCSEVESRDRDLTAVACKQLALHRLPVQHDRAGVAVPYVRALKIDFVEQSKS